MSGEQSKRPKGAAFYQQRLSAWQPILTPRAVILTFGIVGAVFIGLGVLLKIASDEVVELTQTYDSGGGVKASEPCSLGSSQLRSTCSVSFTVTEKMSSPVYVYYELENFYQNHRRYVKSRSDAQLRGDELGEADLTSCEPLVTNSNGSLLIPCGLIAQSLFNDVFTVTNTSSLTMLETDISWKSDREHKFDNPPGYPTRPANVEWLYQSFPRVVSASEGVRNEHFIVWMRTAALPTFRKLYGRIESDIPAGTTLTFNVDAKFRVDEFDGKKTLVLSTTSWLGGRNPFLGIAYIVVGAVCVVLALAFAIKQAVCPRKPGDASRLSWAR